MSRVCEARLLPFVTYENGMQMQEMLVARRQREEIPDQFLLLEHPPVITLGRGGDQANLLATEEMLRAKGVSFYPTTRGGDITFHGPEQLVGYPIIHLGEGNRDVRKYVTKLEEVLIRTVADYGITAARADGKRGIWVGNDKIAAIGVRIARWVTSHGFALNVNTDLNYFSLITPCGLHGTGVTSIAKCVGDRVELRDVRERAIHHFAEVFQREIVVREESMPIVKVLIHDDDRILLLHRRPECGGFWQPVTGGIDAGESAIDAARREVREETGSDVEPQDLGFRNAFVIDPEYLNGATEPVFADETTFFASMDHTRPIVLDTEEHDEARWFSFDEARSMVKWSDDREALDIFERRMKRTAPAVLALESR